MMDRAALLAARAHAQALLDSIDLALSQSPPAAPVLPPPVAGLAGIQNLQGFFDVLKRTNILGPTISETEAAGCIAILNACAGKYPTSWTAYALATAYHETAHTMLPIKEYGGDAYYKRMYDIQGSRPDKARELGNLTPGDGVRYCGRGYVQLTGKANYQKAQDKVAPGLVANPDLAMVPDIAAKIMVQGMRDGWFTGKALRDYILQVPTREQYVNARRIINGTDKAAEIADYALTFYEALIAGAWK